MEYWKFKKGKKNNRGKVKSNKNIFNEWKNSARKYNDADEIEL